MWWYAGTSIFKLASWPQLVQEYQWWLNGIVTRNGSLSLWLHRLELQWLPKCCYHRMDCLPSMLLQFQAAVLSRHPWIIGMCPRNHCDRLQPWWMMMVRRRDGMEVSSQAGTDGTDGTVRTVRYVHGRDSQEASSIFDCLPRNLNSPSTELIPGIFWDVHSPITNVKIIVTKTPNTDCLKLGMELYPLSDIYVGSILAQKHQCCVTYLLIMMTSTTTTPTLTTIMVWGSKGIFLYFQRLASEIQISLL